MVQAELSNRQTFPPTTKKDEEALEAHSGAAEAPGLTLEEPFQLWRTFLSSHQTRFGSWRSCFPVVVSWISFHIRL